MLRIRTDEAPVLVDSPLIPGRYVERGKPRQPVPGEALSATEKTAQLKIDALKEAAASGSGRRRDDRTSALRGGRAAARARRHHAGRRY